MNNAKNQTLTHEEVERLIADSEKWENGTLGADEKFVAISPRCKGYTSTATEKAKESQ